MERQPLEIVFPGSCWGPQVLPGEMEGAVRIPHPARWQGQPPCYGQDPCMGVSIVSPMRWVHSVNE